MPMFRYIGYTLIVLYMSIQGLWAAPRPSAKDSTRVVASYAYTQDKSYIAKRTAMKSALIPGWGQYMNKQYVKIPVIYIALGTAGYFIVDNYQSYTEARLAYLYRQDNDPTTEVEKYKFASLNLIQSRKKTYREYVDYSVLVALAFYTLNILDAAVFAHLQDFDISSSVAMRPSLQVQRPMGLQGPYTPSLGIYLYKK